MNNFKKIKDLIIKKDCSIDKLCNLIKNNPLIEGKIFVELFNETNEEIKKQLKIIALHLIDLTEFIYDTNYNLKFGEMFDENKIEEILKSIDKRLSNLD